MSIHFVKFIWNNKKWQSIKRHSFSLSGETFGEGVRSGCQEAWDVSEQHARPKTFQSSPRMEIKGEFINSQSVPWILIFVSIFLGRGPHVYFWWLTRGKLTVCFIFCKVSVQYKMCVDTASIWQLIPNASLLRGSFLK